MDTNKKSVYEEQWKEMRRRFERLDSASAPFLIALVFIVVLQYLAKTFPFTGVLDWLFKQLTQGVGFLILFVPCGVWMLYIHLQAMDFRCPRCGKVFALGREIYRVSTYKSYKCPHYGLAKDE